MSLGKIIDLPAAEYHNATALSHSKLEAFRRRPALYKRRFVDGIKREPWEAHKFRIGSALHAAAEGVDAFTRTVSVNTAFQDFRAKAAQQWRDDVYASGKVAALLGDEAERVGQMLNALQGHPVLGPLLSHAQAEVTWRASHPRIPVPLQCRTDLFVGDGTVIDLKTCASLDEGDYANFQRSYWKFGYHRQAAFYREILRLCGVTMKEFLFAAVEDDEPFGVDVYRVGEDDLRVGDEENGADLANLIECYRSGTWPNRPTEVREISLPDEYVRRHDVA